MKLKLDELEFLKRYGVKPEEVYDGIGQTQERRRTEAKRQGKMRWPQETGQVGKREFRP